MKIISLCEGEAPRASVFALGMFDGVHLGHRRIISAAKNISTELGIPTSVLIFSSSPHRSKELLPLSDRLSELKSAGADFAYVYDFCELRDLSPESFVTDLLCKKLGAMALVAGYNYHFGKFGAGDGDMLLSLAAKNGIKAHICERVETLDDAVSSTRIRGLLLEGDVATANELLTYNYYLNAPVLHGKALGRKLGLPTINQEFSEGSAPMAHGIYYTKTEIDGKDYISVSNLGARPTVENGGRVNLETHILDFDGDLYGKTVKVKFFGKGRGEECFESVDALREAVMLDCEKAREFFKTKE